MFAHGCREAHHPCIRTTSGRQFQTLKAFVCKKRMHGGILPRARARCSHPGLQETRSQPAYLYQTNGAVRASSAVDVLRRVRVELALGLGCKTSRFKAYQTKQTNGGKRRRTRRVPEVDDQSENDHRKRDEVQPVHRVVLCKQ